MKTAGMAVLCDYCKRGIPPMHPRAIFLTLRGPRVGHRKADLCDSYCLAQWAAEQQATLEAACIR